MTTALFSPEALEDLGAALFFLKARRPRAAERLLRRINSAISLLAEGGVDGPESVLTTRERVRRWIVTPYIVYYERRDDVLHIVRVYHGRRAPIED